MFATAPDLLRLVAVPVMGWAAYRDVRTRRVPNRTWLPLAVLGIVLLVWEGWRVWTGQALADPERYFLRVALSLGLVAPVGYLFYWFGGFGGADAKALIVLALLFPTFPQYLIPGEAFPLTRTTLGVFSLTILTNTVIAGVCYPLAVTGRNALRGRFAPVMFVGRPVPVDDITDAYGSLLETPEGFTRRGLDVDALRMYLRWRGRSLSELRGDPERYRDPDSLPADPNPPGDGAIEPGPVPDTGPTVGERASDERRDDVGSDEPADEASGETAVDRERTDDGSASDGAETAHAGERGAPVDSEAGDDDSEAGGDADETTVADPWGAEAFLDDIDGSAYGTTPAALREGLEVLVDRDVVWLSPGMPFLVPMFVGLLLSLVYGDVLVSLVSVVGDAVAVAL